MSLPDVLNHKYEILAVACAVVAGASVALKAIAPLTKNVKDDRVLAGLEKLLAVLEKLALNTKR